MDCISSSAMSYSTFDDRFVWLPLFCLLFLIFRCLLFAFSFSLSIVEIYFILLCAFSSSWYSVIGCVGAKLFISSIYSDESLCISLCIWWPFSSGNPRSLPIIVCLPLLSSMVGWHYLPNIPLNQSCRFCLPCRQKRCCMIRLLPKDPLSFENLLRVCSQVYARVPELSNRDLIRNRNPSV